MVSRRAVILMHTVVILKHVINTLTIEMWNLIPLFLNMGYP